MQDVYDHLDRLLAERDRDDMAPTIAALREVFEQHPSDARVLYELAGAYDTGGQEEEAAGLYRRALDSGLSGDIRRRCLLQYGSTLRNLGRFEESLALFASARREFPESASLAAFEAISLHAAGDADAAVGALLDVVAEFVDAPELERYKPALRGNAAYLRERDGRTA